MKRSNVVFVNNNGKDYNIPVVELKIKYGDSRITLFTNLVQWFVYINKDPDNCSVIKLNDFISRNFNVNGAKVYEFDDVVYRVKYLFNNGQYDIEQVKIVNRIETAIHNSKVKPEFIESVIKCLEDEKV